jgi:AraC-like DNA-binding protein/signal transduction histidine kinase/ABC-type sugar transport system substrate-binding protein
MLLPAHYDAQRLVDGLLTQRLDALVASNLPKFAAYQLLEAGLPLISVAEVEIQHPLAASVCGLFDVARTGAAYLSRLIQGSGHVLVVGGLMDGLDNGRSRLQGINAVFSQCPGIRSTHIPTPWDYEGAYQSVLSELSERGEPIDAIIGLSDSLALAAQAAASNLKLISRQAQVVGINGDPQALAAIQAGTMAATVETSATDLGVQAVDLAFRAGRGERIPAHFNYKTRLVTGENVAEVAVQKLVAIAELPNRLVGVNRRQEQERLTQLETSLEISRRIASILERSRLSREMADLIRGNFGYDEVQLYLWNEEERAFILDSAEPGAAGAAIPLDKAGHLGQALMQNRLLFVPDVRREQSGQSALSPEIISRMVLPIRFGAHVLGLLDLCSRRPMYHTNAELAGLQSLADQLGVAMRNVQLYGQALDARAEAERANQLKTRLLANVSHELRTPLNVILGYSQSALKTPNPYDMELPPMLVRDLQHICHAGDQLAKLINGLLDLAQAEAHQLEILPETIDPCPIFQEIAQGFRNRGDTDRKPELRLDLPPELPPIQADPVRFRQILTMLLDGASRTSAQRYITLGAETCGDELHFWIEGSGARLSSRGTAQLLDPLTVMEELNSTQFGVGLSLSIACRLVDLHGGVLSLEWDGKSRSWLHVLWPVATKGRRGQPQLQVRGSGQTAGDGSPPSSGAEALVQQAIVYIHLHYARSFSRQEIADAVGVSATYLTRLFRQKMGLSLWQYVNQYRIAQAQRLLTSTTKSVTEIATLVGFNDPAYFSRAFRKVAGISPQRYRQQHE